MVRLDRCDCPDEDDWKARIDKAFPRRCAFWKKARAFEKLVLNGATRRGGFAAYAGKALPLTSKTKRDFPALWRKHKRLVKVLSGMSKGHCAYCQKYIRDELYVAVEHFQPKSLFPMLAYTWENYLPSCGRCNSKKLDRWPAKGAYVRPDDGADPAVRFVFDEKGRIRAARAGDEEAEATIEDLGLNRGPLRRMRRTEIRFTMKALRGAVKIAGGDEDKLRRFFRGQMRARLSRFSEAVNQNVRREWASCGARRGAL